jgi:hypothetical protein
MTHGSNVLTGSWIGGASRFRPQTANRQRLALFTLEFVPDRDQVRILMGDFAETFV